MWSRFRAGRPVPDLKIGRGRWTEKSSRGNTSSRGLVDMYHRDVYIVTLRTGFTQTRKVV